MPIFEYLAQFIDFANNNTITITPTVSFDELSYSYLSCLTPTSSNESTYYRILSITQSTYDNSYSLYLSIDH